MAGEPCLRRPGCWEARRDGRSLEPSLDAAESVTWWLDTVFALRGLVRPYNKYLPWALRQHPLGAWDAEHGTTSLEGTLDGWGDQLDLLRRTDRD